MVRTEGWTNRWNDRLEDADPDVGMDDGATLARALGWFSIGLGLLETLAPQQVARWLGVERKAGFVRACGMRELTNGAAILRDPQRAQWMWARVAGDVIDLAGLAGAMSDENPHRGRVTTSSMLVAGIAVLDLVCGVQLARRASSV